MARVVLEGERDPETITRFEVAGHEVAPDGDVVVRFGMNGPRQADVPHLDRATPDLDPAEVDACLEAIAAGPALDEKRLHRLRAMLGGDDGFGRFVPVYIEEGKKQLAMLHDAIAAGDAAGAHRAAHTLKPTSGMVGAVALEEACRRLEQRARDGDMEGAIGLSAAIQWLFDHAVLRLEAA